MFQRFFEKLDAWAQKRAADPYFLWKLFGAALFLRVAFVMLHPQINLISDMLGYHESAVSLLDYGDFRVKGRLSATRPPLYSVYIYLVYYLFGTGNLFALRLSQAVLGSFTAVLTYKLARKVFSDRAAVWAGLFYALYPAGIGYCDMILTETLFTFLLMAGLIFLVDVPDGKYSDAVLAALFLGAATLTRTVLFLFPLGLLIFYVLFYRKRFSYLPKLVLLVVTFWLVLVPWMARNQRVFQEPILTTKSGVDFYLYNHNPFINILFNYSVEGEDVFQGIVPWKLSELERDRICREAAIEWIKEHPFLFLFKGVRMQWNFFGVEREFVWSLIAGYWGRIPRWMLALSFFVFAPWIYILMPMFIWGVVYSWKRCPKARNLLLMIGYFLAVTFVYYGFSRHRAPLNPVMMVFAGFALTQSSTILSELRFSVIRRHPRAMLALGIFAFYVVGWLLEIAVDAGSLFNLGFTHEVWKNFSID